MIYTRHATLSLWKYTRSLYIYCSVFWCTLLLLTVFNVLLGINLCICQEFTMQECYAETKWQAKVIYTTTNWIIVFDFQYGSLVMFSTQSKWIKLAFFTESHTVRSMTNTIVFQLWAHFPLFTIQMNSRILFSWQKNTNTAKTSVFCIGLFV